MSNTDQDFQLRWARASSWARGQNFGPRAQGVAEEECREIERIRDLINLLGEDEAWEAEEGRRALDEEEQQHG
jgi:hypothetical protein